MKGVKGRITYGKPRRYFLGDREVTAKEFHAAFPKRSLAVPPAGPALTGWPIVSDALAVHPKQVKEAEAAARKHGVPTEFTPLGQPILRDRNHRRRYMKVRGVYDRHSFTGH